MIDRIKDILIILIPVTLCYLIIALFYHIINEANYEYKQKCIGYGAIHNIETKLIDDKCFVIVNDQNIDFYVYLRLMRGDI